MFKIYDGRNEFYQWDLNRKVIVSDNAITKVHFCNKTDDNALVVEVREEDGIRVADVPNILLQNSWPICVYGSCGECYTRTAKTFKVIARTKPSDYIYTETDIYEIEKVVAKVIDEMIWDVVERVMDEAVEERITPAVEEAIDVEVQAQISDVVDAAVTSAVEVAVEPIQQSVADAEAALTKSVNDTEAALTRTVSDKVAELEESVGAKEEELTKYVEDTAAALTKTVNDTNAALTKKVNDTSAALSKEVNDTKAALNEDLGNLSTDLGNHINSSNRNFQLIEEDITAIKEVNEAQEATLAYLAGKPTPGLMYGFDYSGNCLCYGIGTATATDIVIADTYEGQPVTGIECSAFMSTKITSVKIPETITSIGSGAFSECRNLYKINIPDGVTSIDSGTFMSCTSLSEIALGNSITYISNDAFGCSGLRKVTIGTGLTDISYSAFSSCYNLETVYIYSDKVNTIDRSTFSYCENLRDIYVSWGEGEVSGAPWGYLDYDYENDIVITPLNVTVHYNTPKPLTLEEKVEELNVKVGDIDAALEAIIARQSSVIGGIE